MSFLIFQFEVGLHKDSHSSVTSGIKVRCHHYVSQGIIVCIYQEGLIGQVLLEMFCHCPLQCQQFKLSQMVVLLMRHKGSAAVGNRVISSIHLLLRQHHAETILWCISLQQKWFSIVSKRQDWSCYSCLFQYLESLQGILRERDIHSDFLLAPSPVRCSWSGCTICTNHLISLL